MLDEGTRVKVVRLNPAFDDADYSHLLGQTGTVLGDTAPLIDTVETVVAVRLDDEDEDYFNPEGSHFTEDELEVINA